MSRGVRNKKGEWGERRAAAFLKGLGYSLVARNFKIREGEVDIIAWHEKPTFGNTLVFVEVKTRTRFDGSAERAVGQFKLGKMQKVARVYCMRNYINIEKTPIQFEQVSVYSSSGDEEIRHYIIPIA